MPVSSRFVVRSSVGLLAVGFLMLLAIVGATIWLGERARIYVDDAIEARDIRFAAVELRSALQTAESSQRGYIVTGNEIYLAPYDSAKAQAAQQLATLKRHGGDQSRELVLARLTSIVDSKSDEMERSIAHKKEGRDADALAVLRTNRGKALMDEANVFLSGIIQAADDRLTAGVNEQKQNAAMLRLVSIVAAIVIMLVVAIVAVTVVRYTREIAAARDEVRALNAGLEERVKARTADLTRARDRTEVLLAEVNHRVANSLSMVGSLVKLQGKAVSEQAAKDALAETQARIYAIASVHKRLYSSGDVRFVSLDEYLSGILDHLATSTRKEGHVASLRYELDPLKLPTDASINLGVVVTELVTNALKYAYPTEAGEIRVRLKQLGDEKVELVVEDDGIGLNQGSPAQGTGLGGRIVRAMASSMGAEIQYVGRQPGTAARLTFPLAPENAGSGSPRKSADTPVLAVPKPDPSSRSRSDPRS